MVALEAVLSRYTARVVSDAFASFGDDDGRSYPRRGGGGGGGVSKAERDATAAAVTVAVRHSMSMARMKNRRSPPAEAAATTTTTTRVTGAAAAPLRLQELAEDVMAVPGDGGDSRNGTRGGGGDGGGCEVEAVRVVMRELAATAVAASTVGHAAGTSAGRFRGRLFGTPAADAIGRALDIIITRSRRIVDQGDGGGEVNVNEGGGSVLNDGGAAAAWLSIALDN